jgi:hypothetical protein
VKKISTAEVDPCSWSPERCVKRKGNVNPCGRIDLQLECVDAKVSIVHQVRSRSKM